MRKTYRHKRRQPKKIVFRKNKEIRVPELRVINESGEMLGVMPTQEALELAQEKDFDLIEVSPKAKPPVAKLLDYGKFQYQQEKLQQKQKQTLKKVATKGIRLSLRISSNDLNMKYERARKFLEKGNKIKVEMILKGREHQHTQTGKDLINDFIGKLKEEFPIELESPVKKQGGKLMGIVFIKKD